MTYNFELLNIIKSNGIRNRIKKELSKCMDDNSLFIENIHQNEDGNAVITIYDYNSQNLNTYQFEITQHYPFNAPKIKVNGDNYIDFLRIHSNLFRILLNKIKRKNCFCCNSYLCSENWSPVYNIISIIKEIRDFRKIRREVVDKYYADKIKKKYLIEDVQLDCWLF
jgi:ubiquitin-protein ligase